MIRIQTSPLSSIIYQDLQTSLKSSALKISSTKNSRSQRSRRKRWSEKMCSTVRIVMNTISCNTINGSKTFYRGQMSQRTKLIQRTERTLLKNLKLLLIVLLRLQMSEKAFYFQKVRRLQSCPLKSQIITRWKLCERVEEIQVDQT